MLKIMISSENADTHADDKISPQESEDGRVLSPSFAVLVLSCDKYADLWPAFFKCFRENFPISDWPIYLGSNTKESNEPGVKTILSGEDVDWSTSYINILNQIPQEKIFVILEDLLPSSKVDGNILTNYINFMFEKDANHIRYWPNPKPDIATDNSLIGECKRGAPYRATVCGFWDRDYLLQLLLKGENPWYFEILGSYRTSYSDGFYATYTPICEHKNMIEKGQWIPASLHWAQKEGLPIIIDSRPILTGDNLGISLLQRVIFKGIIRIPWKYRVRLAHFLRKLLISY